MALIPISAQDALARLDQFDTVIDARSEGEYALDRLPGALNWPTLNDDERRIVGTEYKQISAFDAKKIGAAMAARNIAAHLDAHMADKPKGWKPLVYCWRGGQRSGILSHFLSQIGFQVHWLTGGYKAFRSAMLADLDARVAAHHFIAVCGLTGTGKTRLLHSLARAGAQVLDLEGLAGHRSSVLGKIPGVEQPSQKQFDMRIWDTLRRFDAAKPVWVESESKKVGNVSVPEQLMLKMRASRCVRIDLSVSERVALLLEDYEHFVQDPSYFCERLDTLRALRGNDTINAWQALARTRERAAIAQVFEQLLTEHYDPGYLTSTRRNFKPPCPSRPPRARNSPIPNLRAMC
jgi:tRNA 2-selenouridine synthase